MTVLVWGRRWSQLPRRAWRRASWSGASALSAVSTRLKVRSWRQELQEGAAPVDVLDGVDDRWWLWLNTVGVRKEPTLEGLVPGLPDASVQLEFTGTAGDLVMREAWNIYRLVREQYNTYSPRGPLGRSTQVLDFGCGWGRVIRFLLKEVEPARLWGIDCDRDVIDVCRRTNRWCTFLAVDPSPPTTLEPATFDLIYAYSVFSHLSEKSHDEWLDEFSRLMRPGGVLVLTTRPRSFIEMCAWLRTPEAAGSPASHLVSGGAFLDTAAALADYDAGRYCFSHRGPDDPPHFGETCIPRAYVLEHWTNRFEFLDFIDDQRHCPQNVIVLRKR